MGGDAAAGPADLDGIDDELPDVRGRCRPADAGTVDDE
jgi:hypothetical protein